MFYPIKVLGLLPPGLNQVEPATLGAKMPILRPKSTKNNKKFCKKPTNLKKDKWPWNTHSVLE